jgi:hypothetical protein
MSKRQKFLASTPCMGKYTWNKCARRALTVIMKKLITAKEHRGLSLYIHGAPGEQVVITAGAKNHVHIHSRPVQTRWQGLIIVS